MKMYCLFGVNGGNGFLFVCADHDRPLSKSGKEDAMKVSLKLQQLGWIPELILSRLGILWCDIQLGFPFWLYVDFCCLLQRCGTD
jgi:hypothetical protein